MRADPLQTIEDRLAEHGNAPRRRNDQITARCPAHEDRTPSLSIRPGKDQPLIMLCRAGCSTDSILAALNLTWDDVSKPLEKVQSAVTARYQYHDEAGQLLYTVERIEPGYDGRTKSFRQVPASGKTGPGAMNGVRRVPYRLPQVLEAITNGDPVFICEGEKDADNLIAAGYMATTNAGGADHWTAAWNTWLEGAKVAVVVDRDAVGYARGAYIAGSLHNIAAQVTILEPIDGKDVSDHLHAGHKITDLRKISLAQAISSSNKITAEETPAVDPNRLMQYLVDWDTAWTADTRADWLIEPFIAAGRAHTLYAGAKTGKSLFTLYACAAAALTEPVFGMPLPGTDPIKTLYIDMEMTLDDLLERLADMGYDGRKLFDLHYMQLPNLKPLDTPEGGAEVVALAIELGVQLVVIDTTSRVISGEENSADTFRYLYMHTIQPLKSAGIATVRLDHSGKDVEKGQRGSSAKNDDVDVVYRLTRTTDGVTLTATHRRMGWVPEHTNFVMSDEPLSYTMSLTDGVPADIIDVLRLLDQLQIPHNVSSRFATQALKDAGHPTRRAKVVAALKARRRYAKPADTAATDPDDELI